MLMTFPPEGPPVMLTFDALTAPRLFTENVALVPVLVVAPAKNARPVDVLVLYSPEMYGETARAL